MLGPGSGTGRRVCGCAPWLTGIRTDAPRRLHPGLSARPCAIDRSRTRCPAKCSRLRAADMRQPERSANAMSLETQAGLAQAADAAPGAEAGTPAGRSVQSYIDERPLWPDGTVVALAPMTRMQWRIWW